MNPFPPLTSREKSLTILDLMVVVAVSALSLAALDASGPAPRVSVPLAAFLLAAGHVLWWLPSVAAPEHRRWLDAIALPLYMVLAVAYVLAAALALYLVPHVAALVVASYGFVSAYLCFRP